MRKFAFLCFTLIILLTSVFSIGVQAEENNSVTSEIFAIARGGDTSEHPQNSLEAIEACLELNIDAVSATVRKTSDGKFVLFENESTKGICTGKDRNISETDFETLSSLFLLSDFGNATESKIALLSDALKLIDGEMIMLIDCEEEILDEIYEEVYKNGFAHDVIFRCREMKNEDLLSWSNSKDVKPSIIPSYKGNVIFSAINEYNFAEDNNTGIAEFATKNLYGVIYSNFFAKRFDNVKALAPVYEDELCGKRPDSVTGWENLLKLGYSVIETGNAKEFSKYISLVEDSLIRLESLYNDAKAINLSVYTSTSTQDFKKHLKTAEEILTTNKASSHSEISACIENIKLSSEEFENANGEENKTFSVTPMKIFWIIFALALFISSQIYLHKKTQKK